MSENQMPEAEAAKAIRKRCPLDGAVLIHKLVDDLWGWECPECGYFEPDPM